MRKLFIIGLLMSMGAVNAAEPAKKAEPPKKAAVAKKPAQPAKKANDPKWKENSMAKKQRECKADPALPQCAKKAAPKK